MKADFRSDTFTKPTPGMLEAMMHAEVGDDVFCEDPSVNRLEAMACEMFAMPAALYCPTGTMSNQIAIKCHTQPGDEVICEKNAHVYIYEGGGIAFNSLCQTRPIEGDRGRITAAQILAAINPDDVHKARTSLVCIENTSNRGGGSCYDFAEIQRIRKVCDKHHLKFHLDGARLFNALTATKQSAAQYGQIFDSLSVCLNKGMGCPVGSILLGSSEFIAKARRIRKVLGGGMRQAGYMAASGIYALTHHINRLERDHAHARLIEQALQKKSLVKSVLPVETNIVIFELTESMTPAVFVNNLAAKGMKALAVSDTQVRLVTHLDISEEMIEHLLAVIRDMDE